MGLWLMIVGVVGAGVVARPDLGEIAPSETLQLPTSASAARLFAPSSGKHAMVLHPGELERNMALLASRSEGVVYGQIHDYAVRSLDVSSLDGVSVGSAWQVFGPAGAATCSVTGFEHVEAIDPVVSDAGAPCGQPLVQAVLSCEGATGAVYGEGIAIPAVVPVSVAETSSDVFVEARDHAALEPIAATALFQEHERALAERGEVEVSFSSRSVLLDGAEMTILSGVLYAPGDAVALSAVVRDGVVVYAGEGAVSTVFDIGQDGKIEVLGWDTPDSAVSGVTWTLRDADHTLAQETINWCEAGC